MTGDGRINAQTGNNTAQGKQFVAVQHSGRSRRLSELGRSIFAQHSEPQRAPRGGGGGGGGDAAKPTSQMNTTEMLMYIFSYYCKFGRTGGHGADEQTLDSFNYMKLCKARVHFHFVQSDRSICSESHLIPTSLCCCSRARGSCASA